MPAHHAAVTQQIGDSALAAAALRLLDAGAPLVIGRQPRSGADYSAPMFIAAGLPLPPALGKHRLAFRIPRHAIERTAPPLKLADVIPCLPGRWREPLRMLLRGAESIRIEFTVYGSAAWAALTGETYLTPQSDIDLLWRPKSADQLAAGIALLAEWEAISGLRADGEILFGDDAAVAWREWNAAASPGPPPRVLVKVIAGARLGTRAQMLACLPTVEAGPMTCA